MYYAETLKLPKDFEKYVKNDLTVLNPDYINAQKMNRSTKSIKKNLRFYNETSKYIEVPRLYRHPAIPMDNIVDNTIWENPRDYLEFNSGYSLKENQQEALEILIDSKGNRIIEMPTGSGKTVTAIGAICYFKRRTLVFVNKKNLQYQWKNELEKFSNAKVGILGDGKMQIGNQYDVVVATVQSIQPYHKKKFKHLIQTEFFKNFDIVIVDEAHNFSAETFNRAISYFPARMRLGFTATAFRNDNLDFVFRFTIGDSSKINMEQEIKPKIWECSTKWVDHAHGFFNNRNTNLAQLMTRMTKDKKRNKIILNATRTMAKNDRKFLLLTARVDHAKLFHRILSKEYPKKEVVLLIGSTPQEERDKAKNADFVLATYGVAKEGLDLPLLDTLIYATPIGGNNKVGIVQSIGRLTRAKEGKKGADIYDFVDDEPIFKKMYFKRRSVYYSMGLDVSKINMKALKWR